MSLSLWLGFLAATVLLSVSPGPGAAAVTSTGLREGYAAALRVIVGMQLALFVQLAIVAAGLGALLAASETAFDVLKLCGAGYLVWLGIAKWRADLAPPPVNGAVARGLLGQGLLVNLTNPKAIVFMAALVPQFIDPAKPQLAQFLIIAATICSVDLIVMSGYALLAARLGRWLHDARARRAQNRFFGGVFVVAGIMLALSDRN